MGLKVISIGREEAEEEEIMINYGHDSFIKVSSEGCGLGGV